MTCPDCAEIQAISERLKAHTTAAVLHIIQEEVAVRTRDLQARLSAAEKQLEGKDKLLDEVRNTLTEYGYDMDLQSRLSAAEEERDAARTTLEEKMRLTLADLKRAEEERAAWHMQSDENLDRAKRAEEVVEAAKRHDEETHAGDGPLHRPLRDALRRYEEGKK